MTEYRLSRLALALFVLLTAFWICNMSMDVPMTRIYEGEVTSCQIVHSDTAWVDSDTYRVYNKADIVVQASDGSTKEFKEYRLTQYDDGQWQYDRVMQDHKFYTNNYCLILFMSVFWVVSLFVVVGIISDGLLIDISHIMHSWEDRVHARNMRYDHAFFMMTFFGTTKDIEKLRNAKESLKVRQFSKYNEYIKVPTISEAINEINEKYESLDS